MPARLKLDGIVGAESPTGQIVDFDLDSSRITNGDVSLSGTDSFSILPAPLDPERVFQSSVQRNRGRYNFSLDPCFCNPGDHDFQLWNFSPCSQYACGLMGALPIGCSDPQYIDPLSGRTGLLSLSPAVPSPFATTTRIVYEIPETARQAEARLAIYDPQGRLVRTLGEALLPGISTAIWNGKDNARANVASGTFFCRLTNGFENQTRCIVLTR